MDGVEVLSAESAVQELFEFVQGADIDILAELVSKWLRVPKPDAEPVMVECEGDYSAPYRAGVRGRMVWTVDTKSEPETVRRVAPPVM